MLLFMINRVTKCCLFRKIKKAFGLIIKGIRDRGKTLT